MSGPATTSASGTANRSLRIVTLALLLSLIAALAAGVHLAGSGGAVRQRLRQRHLGSARGLAALMRLERLQVGVDPSVLGDDPPPVAGILTYGRGIARASGPLPSTTLARQAFPEGVGYDLVSIAIDPRDWDDPERGIFTNPFKRGLRWQRGVCLSLFEQGDLVAEATAGVCIHGDSSRAFAEKSLRILLRPRYGASVAAHDLLPGALGDTLVLFNDGREILYASPISYEILRRIGCDAPRARPVRVLLNGRLLQRVFFLMEHVGDSYVRERVGHDHFDRINLKDEEHGHYESVLRLLWQFQPRRLSSVAGHIDVAGAINWVVGILFTACADSRQGIAYRDQREDRWRWVAWDFDWAFHEWPLPLWPSPDVVHDLLVPRGDLRAMMFAILMRDDPEYRRRLLAKVSLALNHELTPRWLDGLVAKYRAIARTYGGATTARALASLDRVERFLQERPAKLRAELREVFEVGEDHQLVVEVAAGCRVRIDGYDYDRDYRGRYFSGQEVDVVAADGCKVVTAEGEPVAGPVEVGASMVLRVVRR